MDRVDNNRLSFLRRNLDAIVEMEHYIEFTPTMVPEQAKQVYKEAKYALIDHLNECWILDTDTTHPSEKKLVKSEEAELKKLWRLRQNDG